MRWSSTFHTSRHARRVTLPLVAALAAGAVAAVPAAARPATPVAPNAVVAEQARSVPAGKTWSTSGLDTGVGKMASPSGATPAVGTVRKLLALDDYNGRLYLKPYVLQAVGDKIEVWVARDTAFPAGDCRLQVADTTTVTRAQARYLADQFDTVMFPKESSAFSVAPDHDGSHNALPGYNTSGDGDKIVTLVDNVRDDSYFLGPVAAPTYIAGFFSTQFNDLMDRNVMTIDAYDWLHRTGANPPADDATTDICTSRPPRPFLYEGTFAHEYQHLLQSYTDPNEVSWVNEGLSDYAISLVGYGLANRTINQPRAESHIYCHQGFGTVQTQYNPNPRACGGPEDSLTLWGDQGDDKILADYGIAWSFMLYLADHYGLGFMSTLHRDGAGQGLVGVQHALDGYAPGTDVYDVIHNFQVMDLVDRYVGGGGGTVTGSTNLAKVISRSLNATVNLGSIESYGDPGAPANGADYVALRSQSGLYLDGRDLDTLSFRGARTLATTALAWTVAANPPGHNGNPAIFSGNASNTDAAAITAVTVPATGNPTLTYDELHMVEEGYDYAYTVVSTDGGRTYVPLANANTVAGPLGPALNGDAEDFATQTFSLSAYKGKSILLGFRYVSDGGVNDGGWWVDDVTVGGTLVSNGSSLAPFDSPSEIRPNPVYRWRLQLVGLDTAGGSAYVASMTGFNATLGAADRAALRQYPRVVAIVGYDEPTEQLQKPATYTLTVNGVVQPGGGASAKAVVAKADTF